MIDIHTHITPNVDDGARDIVMSIEMLRSEAAQGCQKVFLTPSCAGRYTGTDLTGMRSIYFPEIH